MKHYLSSGRGYSVYTICIIGFVYTLHYTLPTYINSSFLEQFTKEQIVGVVYMIGSIVTVLGFLNVHRLLERWGNYRTGIILCVIQFLLYLGLGLSGQFEIIVPFFILSMVTVALIGFTIDVFLESTTTKSTVGGVRGLFLTIANIAWILAPMLSGVLVQNYNYQIVFFASAGLIIPLLYLLHKNLKDFKDPKYGKSSDWATFKKILKMKDLRNLFIANTILNVFYAWMVVYSPIYLNSTIGFGWETIGVIFTIMLLPFILFELPLGKLADIQGEKKIMSVGFLIAGAGTIILSALNFPSVVAWAIALFVTRIGASMVEIMIETYFFKKVPSKNANILGLFRVTRPIAYLIAPIITIVGLSFTSYSYLFIFLGCMMICGLFFTSGIKDTLKEPS